MHFSIILDNLKHFNPQYLKVSGLMLYKIKIVVGKKLLNHLAVGKQLIDDLFD